MGSQQAVQLASPCAHSFAIGRLLPGSVNLVPIPDVIPHDLQRLASLYTQPVFQIVLQPMRAPRLNSIRRLARFAGAHLTQGRNDGMRRLERTTPRDAPSARMRSMLLATLAMLALTGCAQRPVTPALTAYEPGSGYHWDPRRIVPDNDPETLLVLTFSGGGTRAAAF